MKQSNLPIKISALVLENLDDTLKIQRSSFTTPWTRGMLLCEVDNPNSVCLVASLNGKVIGFICCSFAAGVSDMIGLAVLQDYRNNGVARSLISAVLKELLIHNIVELWLEVRESNIIAKRLYEGFGFKEQHIRRDYYSNPTEDAICMCFKYD